MHYSTDNMATLTGASSRQLGYWVRTGVLKPSGHNATGKGSKRRYTFPDIVAAMTIVQLRLYGCPLQKIRKAVKRLRKDYPSGSDSTMLAKLTLMTDGDKVYMLHDEDQVMDVVTHQTVWSVALGQLILEARKKVDALPMEWTEKVKVRGNSYHLRVTRDKEYGGYIVQCKELPGALEQGETADEAIGNGIDAIQSVLAFQARRRVSKKVSKRVQAAG